MSRGIRWCASVCSAILLMITLYPGYEGQAQRSDQRKREEAVDHYKLWLDQDVVYILCLPVTCIVSSTATPTASLPLPCPELSLCRRVKVRGSLVALRFGRYLAILPSFGSLSAGVPAGGGAGQSDGQLAAVLRHYNLGIACLEQYDYRRASEEFRKALEIHPDFVPALVNIGIAYYCDTAYVKAIESFSKALEISPRIPHFREVLGAYPNDPATNYHMGLLFMRGRDYDDAIRYFGTVLKEEPFNVSSLYNLAMVYLRSGERVRGQKLMDEFRNIKGDEQAGGRTMCGQYQEEGRFAMVISQYE